MKHWDLRTVEVEPHEPRVLQSALGEGRAILLALPAGEMLQEHQVHERTYLVVADGEVSIEGPAGTVTGGPGSLAVFDPRERREVRATRDARLLLILAPWPGEGHPGTHG